MIYPLYVTVDHEMYEFALSSTCLVFFLIQSVLAAIVYFDASTRGLYGPMWALITFAIPYLGFPIYLVYIVAFGYTRFHMVKDPAAEEIKRKWEDTESTLEKEREEERRKESLKKQERKKALVSSGDDEPFRRV